MTGPNPAATFRSLITGKEKLLVRLIGPITEVADFGPLQFSRLRPVEIDLGEVTAMNSIGIRDFAAWMASLENPVIEFSHCPKFFIDQVNMIIGLVPVRASFLSFYVPFFSSVTDEEKRVLFVKGMEYKGVGENVTIELPEVRDSKGNPMELDVVSDRYFEFLKRHP